MMNEKTRETFLLWTETEEYKKKVEEAKKIIKNALKTHKKPYVAYSGGKDSTVMLNLILKQKPDILVFHYDYGRYMPRWLEKEVITNAKKIGVQNFLLDSGKNWYKTFFGRIEKDFERKGYDLVFVGIRKEESCKRKARIEEKHFLSKMDECWPLKNWTWKDVWGYIVKNELPYPSVYDKYAELLGYDKVRFVTFFDPEFEKFGGPILDGFIIWKEKNQ